MCVRVYDGDAHGEVDGGGVEKSGLEGDGCAGLSECWEGDGCACF